jgi:hypothetical protein
MPTFYQDEAADGGVLASKNKKRSQQDCAHIRPFIAYPCKNYSRKLQPTRFCAIIARRIVIERS